MKKIMLLLVGILMCAGAFGCKKREDNTVDNITTILDENKTTVEEKKPGTITIEERLLEPINEADASQLFILEVVCDKEWDDVYKDFVLVNDIETCDGNLIYVSKKQLDNLKPVAGYDIVLNYYGGRRIDVTLPYIESLDKNEKYLLTVELYREFYEEPLNIDMVNEFLNTHNVEESAFISWGSGQNSFCIKVYPDEVKSIINDSEIVGVYRNVHLLLEDY